MLWVDACNVVSDWTTEHLRAFNVDSLKFVRVFDLADFVRVIGRASARIVFVDSASAVLSDVSGEHASWTVRVSAVTQELKKYVLRTNGALILLNSTTSRGTPSLGARWNDFPTIRLRFGGVNGRFQIERSNRTPC